MTGFVAIKDSTGTVQTATIGDNGTYSISVKDLTPPYIIYGSGISAGQIYTIYSAATATDEGGTVNITPLTDLILGNVAGQNAEAFFNNPDFTKITDTALSAEESSLATSLAPILTAAGIAAGTDLRTTAFNADHTGMDAVLEVLDISVDTNTNLATITNKLDTNQTITDDLASTVNAGTLDAGTANITDSAAALQAIQATVNALKTVQASGSNTTSDYTPFFSSTMLFNGANQGTLANLFAANVPDLRTGIANMITQMGAASVKSVDLTVNPQVVWFYGKDRVPFKFENDTGAGWKFAGDDRKWEASMRAISQVIHLNNNTTPIRNAALSFDAQDYSGFLTGTPVNMTSNIYFVVTGNGLPANGVVMRQGSTGSADLYHTVLDVDIGAMTDGDIYTIKAYNDVNGDTVFATDDTYNSADTSASDDVELTSDAYTTTMVKRPWKSTESPSFATFTSPSAATLAALPLTAGTVSASWTLPAGCAASSLYFDWAHASGGYWEDAGSTTLNPTATSGTVSFVAPTPTTDVNGNFLELEVIDPYGVHLTTQLNQ